MGSTLASPTSEPTANNPASILAAALAQRKNKVSQSGMSPFNES